MKYLKRQDGIAQVLVVGLVAIVLVAIGLAVWQSQKAKTKADTTTSSPTPTPSVSASPAANEFDVSQLGFKMALPIGLTGLVDSVQMNVPGNYGGNTYTVSSASFSTTALEQAAPTTDCSASSGPIGTIALYSFNPVGKIGGISSASVKQLGGNYLVISGSGAQCSSNAAASTLQA
jgi:hypothetical protein